MNSQVQRSKTITLSRPLKQVFPMFQPEGEKSWTANWDPQYVWPGDGQPRQGLVALMNRTTISNTPWLLRAAM
jgi:hypothetical protein